MITMFVGKVIKTMTVGMASSVFILFLDLMTFHSHRAGSTK